MASPTLPSPHAHPLEGVRGPRWPAWLAMAFVLVTVAVSWYLKFVVGGYWLGAPLAPLYLYPGPQADELAWLAAAVFLAGVAVSPRLLSRRLGGPGFAAAAFALGLALRLALALVREGPHGWLGSLGRGDAQNEYLPALPALSLGVRTFLDRFAEVAPSLPTHPSAHPPGLLLLIDAVGVHTTTQMAALQIAGGALATPLVYVLGRRLLDEGAARLATLLFAFAPVVMTYGVTSSDALYVTAGLAAAVGLVGRSAGARVAGACLLALASFLSYSLLAVGAWAVIVVLRRDGLRRAVSLGAACAAALVVLYAALWALTGFDIFGALHSADVVYRLGIYFSRPYWYWLFGSPAAWLVVMGLPITWYAARALGAGQTAAIALAVVVTVATVGGYTKAETERIWMFLVPFACVAAAAVLPRQRLVIVLALLSAQAFLVELLTDAKY